MRWVQGSNMGRRRFLRIFGVLFGGMTLARPLSLRGVAAESDVSDLAVARRRAALLAEAAAWRLNLNAPDPRHQFPLILARIALDKADTASLDYLAGGARFHGRGSSFGMSSLSRIVAAYPHKLSEAIMAAVREQVTAFPHYLGYGTENHRAMQRSAGLLFGERFPDDTFHHGIKGRELAELCKEYMRRYGREVYASSMMEYLSPTYHMVNTAPWLTVAEYSLDEESRLMARAILDWMMADLALNTHHGVVLPPLTRCTAQIRGYPGANRHALDASMTTAWLYWGTGAHSLVAEDAVLPNVRAVGAPQHAQAGYGPHPAIRNLGAKRGALPFMALQSCASWGAFEEITANPFGFEARNIPQVPPPERRYHLRSVYFHEDYALGAGNFREHVADPQYRTTVPFGAVWRSANAFARLLIGHPYWYAAYKPDTWASPSPEDMWSGTSPFQQSVHWENAVILLFDIPEEDPYREVRLRWGPGFAPHGRRDKPIRSCFAYYPESMDERVRTAAGFFLREGDVYIAIRPLSGGAAWAGSAAPGYKRIDLPGARTGCVVEIGSAGEYGSFAEFQARIAQAKLDTAALATDKRVRYESTRGHLLEISHVSPGGLPEASVNGEPLDFNSWPTCESPYLTCRDRVLDVHDGRQGMKIDWQGTAPIYTYYQMHGGVRRDIGRESIGCDGRLVREGVPKSSSGNRIPSARS